MSGRGRRSCTRCCDARPAAPPSWTRSERSPVTRASRSGVDLLFWHLAARWGRVEPSGIRLTLPLTHRLLGQLVAAERPSISHALGRLSHAGLVTGNPGDWHLHGSVDSHLESLVGPDAHGLRRSVERARSGGGDRGPVP